MISELLRYKKELDLDNPEIIDSRAQELQNKTFLRKIYEDWYSTIRSVFLDSDNTAILELGSGPGYLKKYLPKLITSDIQKCQSINLVLNGCALPFKNSSLGGIVMIDVFHHIPQPQKFLEEAGRCLKPQGVIFMIEPWVSPWSIWVNKKIKHESFLLKKKQWEFTSSGPLSGANQALPWVVFKRDFTRFSKEFPDLTITKMRPTMPLRYIFSGGFAYRGIMPAWSYCFWHGFEKLLEPLMEKLAMFAEITITKT